MARKKYIIHYDPHTGFFSCANAKSQQHLVKLLKDRIFDDKVDLHPFVRASLRREDNNVILTYADNIDPKDHPPLIDYVRKIKDCEILTHNVAENQNISNNHVQETNTTPVNPQNADEEIIEDNEGTDIKYHPKTRLFTSETKNPQGICNVLCGRRTKRPFTIGQIKFKKQRLQPAVLLVRLNPCKGEDESEVLKSFALSLCSPVKKKYIDWKNIRFQIVSTNEIAIYPDLNSTVYQLKDSLDRYIRKLSKDSVNNYAEQITTGVSYRKDYVTFYWHATKEELENNITAGQILAIILKKPLPDGIQPESVNTNNNNNAQPQPVMFVDIPKTLIETKAEIVETPPNDLFIYSSEDCSVQQLLAELNEKKLSYHIVYTFNQEREPNGLHLTTIINPENLPIRVLFRRDFPDAKIKTLFFTQDNNYFCFTGDPQASICVTWSLNFDRAHLFKPMIESLMIQDILTLTEGNDEVHLSISDTRLLKQFDLLKIMVTLITKPEFLPRIAQILRHAQSVLAKEDADREAKLQAVYQNPLKRNLTLSNQLGTADTPIDLIHDDEQIEEQPSTKISKTS